MWQYNTVTERNSSPSSNHRCLLLQETIAKVLLENYKGTSKKNNTQSAQSALSLQSAVCMVCVSTWPTDFGGPRVVAITRGHSVLPPLIGVVHCMRTSNRWQPTLAKPLLRVIMCSLRDGCILVQKFHTDDITLPRIWSEALISRQSYSQN